MNIAMVLDSLQTGGISRVGSAYAQLLLELGHHVTIFDLRPDRPGMAQEFPAECKIVSCYFSVNDAPERFAPMAQRSSTLRRLAYPILYTGLRIRNRMRTHKIHRQSGNTRTFDLAIAFSGHLNDLTFVADGFVRARKTLCWLHGALYQYLLLSPGFEPLYRKIRNLTVLSEECQQEVLSYHPEYDLNIRKLYNPITIAERPIDAEFTETLRQEMGQFLLMVSRFDYPNKDHYTVIDALKILREEYHEDLSLILVGDGPEEAKVRAYAETLGEDITSHIRFCGLRQDVQNFYTAAHLYVQGSAGAEGLPTTILEAMAFDLPVVFSDVKVGPREILKNSEYGLLCGIKDPADMARQIYRLHTDPELYAHFQAQGRARLQDFAPETIRELLAQELAELR